MMLKPCRLSSRCSGSIIFTLIERTKKDTILGSFGTSKYEANCRNPPGNTSEFVLDEALFCGAFAQAPVRGGGGDGVGVVSGARRLLARAPN